MGKSYGFQLFPLATSRLLGLVVILLLRSYFEQEFPNFAEDKRICKVHWGFIEDLQVRIFTFYLYRNDLNIAPSFRTLPSLSNSHNSWHK